MLYIERRHERQFGHADDSIQRRHESVTYVGQEFALGTIGRLGRLFRCQHGLLGRAASSNVDKSDDRTCYLAVPFDGIGPVFSGKTGSIRSPHDLQIAMKRFTRANHIADGALRCSIRRAVRMRMMGQVVQYFVPGSCADVGIPQQTQRGSV